jgi:hypothetical protein
VANHGFSHYPKPIILISVDWLFLSWGLDGGANTGRRRKRPPRQSGTIYRVLKHAETTLIRKDIGLTRESISVAAPGTPVQPLADRIIALAAIDEASPDIVGIQEQG